MNIINNINFTNREIDIIACLLNGRSTKKIASFLLISNRTVENHISNIMEKLKCNSRENIIDFLEKSPQLPLFKHHYANILIKIRFEAELKKIAITTKSIKVINLSIFYSNAKEQNSHILQLEKHLGMTGIKTLARELNRKKLDSNFNNKLTNNHVLYLLSVDLIELFKKINQNFSIKDLAIEYAQNNPNTKTIFLLTSELNCQLHNYLKNCKGPNIHIIQQKNYYYLIFEILTKIMPGKDIIKMMEDFKKQHELVFAPFIVPQIKVSSAKVVLSKLLHTLRTKEYTIKLLRKKAMLLKKVFIPTLIIITLCYFNTKIKSLMGNGVLKILNNTTTSLNWNLPFPNYYFTGRNDVLNQLINKFSTNNTNSSIVTLVACTGMGGVGKTEIAKYFMHNIEKLSKKEYQLKIWFDSERIDNLIEQYVILAKQLEINTKDLDQETIIFQVKQWLEQHSNWIIVYDNADTMGSIMRLLPQRGGDIIITSRNPNWQNMIKINTMPEEEAIALVKQIIQKSDDENDIKCLVSILEGLPLAISQASTYILNRNIAVKDYINIYEQQHELLADSNMPPGNHHSSVYSTFSASIDAIKKMSSDAYLLLNCLAYLDPNSIYYKDLVRFFEHGTSSHNLILDNAIQILRDYSLISPNKNQSISIHRLVQQIIWYRQRQHQETNKWLFKVLDVMNDNVMDDNLVLSAITNTRECLEIIINYYKKLLQQQPTSVIWHSLGCCYLIINDFKNAEKSFLESINLNSNSSIHCEYGMALYLQQKIPEAILQFEHSIKYQDEYNCYFGQVEKPSVDIAIKKLIDKYGIVKIRASFLSSYFLVKCYKKLGNYKQADLYFNNLKKITTVHNDPILGFLIKTS